MKYRVDIDMANSTKAELSDFIDNKDKRILNRVGAFSSLFKFDFSKYSNPVLVLKTEEPGSKQVLAYQYDKIESVCFDMINHLVNDCIVMGAEPLAVQDLIACGRMEKTIIKRIVSAIAEACRAQGCALTGGETTEQPGIIPEKTFILSSSIVGVVEQDKIIDGSQIKQGDQVIALASSGPHTNGYTLIRDLLSQDLSLAKKPVGNRNFIEAVLEPHRCYYQSLKGLFNGKITGMAHITGGGIRENLNRILPAGLDAKIDLHQYRTQEIFKVILDSAKCTQDEMLRTFNMGIGLVAVCRPDRANAVISHLNTAGELAYQIGEIVKGTGKVICHGSLSY